MENTRWQVRSTHRPVTCGGRTATPRRVTGSGEAQKHGGGVRLWVGLTKVYISSLDKAIFVTLCRSKKQSAMGAGNVQLLYEILCNITTLRESLFMHRFMYKSKVE